ncbi:MAG: hypothetical protein JO227_16920, partial [Acetobacteraceae bacterium]|nr:hypothetical protein [Acetobacteraceae bacterium]
MIGALRRSEMFNPEPVLAALREAGNGQDGGEPGARASSALLTAVAEIGRGWTVLQGWSFGPSDLAGGKRGRRYALLHRRIGVALIEIVPGPTVHDAAERLARALDAAGFSRRFGGHPPI